jgi:hypothetical protein
MSAAASSSPASSSSAPLPARSPSQLECGICFESYSSNNNKASSSSSSSSNNSNSNSNDQHNRVPRVLPRCAHTFCTSCIQQLIQSSTIVCPFDKRKFQASSVKDVPINFALCELIERIDDDWTAIIRSQQRQGASVTCDESEGECDAAISYCCDCNAHLCAAHAPPNGHNKSYQRKHKVVKIEDKPSSSSSTFSTPICKEHDNTPCTLFCPRCQCICCPSCAFSSEHQDHKDSLKPIAEVVKQGREKLQGHM